MSDPARIFPAIEWRLFHTSSLGDRVWIAKVVSAIVTLAMHGPEGQVHYGYSHYAVWPDTPSFRGSEAECLEWIREKARAERDAWVGIVGEAAE